MEKKSFFKSTSFKCIITLLCVLLVSGIFLTIMNSLLAVSDQERFDRAINKIYGKKVQAEKINTADYNDIEEAYRIKDDGNYLVKSIGKGGYSGGTVTCWVVVNVSGGTVKGIDKIVVDSNKGQTQIAEISSSYLNKFTTANYETGMYFYTSDGYYVANSTMSSNAVCNSVNGALDFVNALFGNVAADKYKDLNCDYLEYIDTRNTTDEPVENDDGKVTGVKYSIKTLGYGNAAAFTMDITVGLDGKISAYEVLNNGSTGGFESSMDPSIANGSWFVGKNISDIRTAFSEGINYSDIKDGLNGAGLATGATQSSFVCIYAAAFATANYDKLLPELEDDADSGNENGSGEDNGEGGENNE